VRWRATQATLATDLGADVLVELGPGTVLAGLARRAVPDVPIRSAATPEEAAALAEFVAAASTPDLTSTSKGAP